MSKFFPSVMTFCLIGVALMASSVGCQAQGGQIWAWGDNLYGQLGNDTTTNEFSPVNVVGLADSGLLSNVKAVATGGPDLAGGFSLALKNDGTVWAWGYNASGQLGNGTTTSSYTPVQVLGPGGSGYLTNIIAIAAGNNHSVALAGNNTVWAWGDNSVGELGDGTTINRLWPVEAAGPGDSGYLTNIIAIAAGGSDFTLALAGNKTVWAWGNNMSGELGDGSNINKDYPIEVHGPGGSGYLTNITAIAAGNDYSVALAGNTTVWTWGDNEYGSLGDGNTTTTDWPVEVVGLNDSGYLTDITAIAAGFHHVLALDSSGALWAWGPNESGELGIGTSDLLTHSSPAQVVSVSGSGTLASIISISAGDRFSLALRNDGILYSWGFNGDGELGDGSNDSNPHPTPVQNAALIHLTGISAGQDHGLAVSGYQLLWQNTSTGDTYQWLMNAATEVSGSEIQAGVASGWKMVGTGSFSGNTTPDILWQDVSTGEVGIWTMSGGQRQGYTQIESPGIIAAGWRAVGTADINGNGYTDIVWQNLDTGEVGYWNMDGTEIEGYVRIEAPGVIGAGWRIVGAPDLLGTGSPVLLWQNTSTGEIGYWTLSDGVNQGYTQIEAPDVVSTVWHIAATPDINGDGQADIVWQNLSTGEIGYWLMSDGQRQSYTQIEAPGVIGAGWLIGGAF